MPKHKVFLTKDNTILIVNIRYGEAKSNPYWSITANEIEPIGELAGEARARDYLEDGELWKMAVKTGNTKEGLEEWINTILDIDGWQYVIDCSLYPHSHEIDDKYYWYVSSSCGCLHDEIFKVMPWLLFAMLCVPRSTSMCCICRIRFYEIGPPA